MILILCKNKIHNSHHLTSGTYCWVQRFGYTPKGIKAKGIKAKGIKAFCTPKGIKGPKVLKVVPK